VGLINPEKGSTEEVPSIAPPKSGCEPLVKINGRWGGGLTLIGLPGRRLRLWTRRRLRQNLEVSGQSGALADLEFDALCL
jgi:hypothetical protein